MVDAGDSKSPESNLMRVELRFLRNPRSRSLGLVAEISCSRREAVSSGSCGILALAR